MLVSKLSEIAVEGERKIEAMRRQDVNTQDVAQESLDVYKALEAAHKSSSELLTEYGFLPHHVVKVAIHDEKRIISELHRMPSADVVDGVLKVSAVMIANSIDEFVPEPEPDPEVIE